MNKALRAVALMGATCSGKSRLALRLAEQEGAAIVCCDSMQVYRGLDIGTAKPDAAERAGVRHAMVDCFTLPDICSAASWAVQAGVFIRDENTAGRVPLIVGGTGLYLRALIEGMADIPPEDEGVRANLVAQCAQQGVKALHAELTMVDAATAARLQTTDSQRILRALSVYYSSGRPLSTWLTDAAPAASAQAEVFVLDIARNVLNERITGRFQAMLDAGWLNEVRWLDGLLLPDTHPVLRAVGYRQLLAYLHGEDTLAGATEKGITATRHYAKRQRTWFAHQTSDAVHGDAVELAPRICAALERAGQSLGAGK